MKKGYVCPSCGNRDTSSLCHITPGKSRQSVLMEPSKVLNNSEARICCEVCNYQAEANCFRIKRNKTFQHEMRVSIWASPLLVELS